MSTEILFGSVTAAVLLILYLTIKIVQIARRPYKKDALSVIPGPPSGNFLLGNVPQIISGKPLEMELKWATEYNSSLGLFKIPLLWNDYHIFVTNPELIKTILNEPVIFDKIDLPPYRLLEQTVGNGLVSMSQPTHTVHRKLINPAFKFGELKGMVQIFRDHANELVQQLDKHNGENVCVNELMNKVTLNIIGSAGFGFNFSAFDPNPETLGAKTFEAFSELLAKAGFLSMFLPIVNYLPTPGNFKAVSNQKFVNDVVLQVIKSKREQLHSNTYQPHDILDLLLAAQEEEKENKLTDDELISHVKTFLIAGHETTSMLLTWTFYAISQHPEIISKLRKEISSTLGDSDDFSMADLEKLTYMNNVMKESLRVHPPVCVVSRKTSCDTKLGEVFIPKNTTIAISPKVLNYLPSVWNEPDKFNPDRWENLKIHSSQFIPFLKGTRNCIGQKFAMLEAKVILLAVLRKYHFEMPTEEFNKVEQVLTITLKPKENLFMKVSKNDAYSKQM